MANARTRFETTVAVMAGGAQGVEMPPTPEEARIRFDRALREEPAGLSFVDTEDAALRRVLGIGG